jgi:carbonic anhydrase
MNWPVGDATGQAPVVSGLTRRSLLRTGVLTAGGLAAGWLAGCAAPATSAPSSEAPVETADQALARLMAGNDRFANDSPLNHGQDTHRRAATAEGQTPFAVILGCSDSRVPPEVIFDQGLGDLFTVRVAGNTIADASVVGTIEYGAEHLGAVLVLVLGHESCGAVKATIDFVQSGEEAHGHIQALVDPIVPAVDAVRDRPEDEIFDAAVQRNVRDQVDALTASEPILAHLVSEGSLKVGGAIYRLESGRVDVLA